MKNRALATARTHYAAAWIRDWNYPPDNLRKELMMEAAKMKIDVSAMHTKAEYEELYAVTYNGFELTALKEAPIPWDANIIPGLGQLCIEGAVGPHGIGACIIKLSRSSFHRHYVVDVTIRERKRQEAIDYLTSLGIKIL